MSFTSESDEKIEVELEVNLTPSLAHMLDEKPGLFAESTESLIKAAIMNTKKNRTQNNIEDHILNKFSKISPTAVRRCASVLKMQTTRHIPKAGIKLRIKNSMVKVSTANSNSRKGFVCGQKDIQLVDDRDEGHGSESENLRQEMFLYEDTDTEFNSKTMCVSDVSVTSGLVTRPSCLKNSVGDAATRKNDKNRKDSSPRLVTFVDDQQEKNLGPFARKTISTDRYERWIEDMKKMNGKKYPQNQIVLSNPGSKSKLQQSPINKYTNCQNIKSVQKNCTNKNISSIPTKTVPHLKTKSANVQERMNSNMNKQDMVNKYYDILKNNNLSPPVQNSDKKVSAQFIYEIINFFNKDNHSGNNAPRAQVVCPASVESGQVPKHKHSEKYSKKMTKIAKNPPKLSSESGQSRELRTYNFIKCLSPSIDESEPCYCSNCMATSILSESEKRPYIERPHRNPRPDLVARNHRELRIQEIFPKSSSSNKPTFNSTRRENTKTSDKIKEEIPSTSKSFPKKIKKDTYNPSMQTIYSSKADNPANKESKTNGSDGEVPEKKNFIKNVLSKLKLLENKVRVLEKDSSKETSKTKLRNDDIKENFDIFENPSKESEYHETDSKPTTSIVKTSRNFDKNVQVDMSITELDDSTDVSRNVSGESKLVQIHYTDPADFKKSQNKSGSSESTRGSKNDELNLSSGVSDRHKALSATSHSFMVLMDSKPSDFNVKRKIQEIIEYKLLKIKKDLIELRYLNQVVLNDSEYFKQKDLFPSYKKPLGKKPEKVNCLTFKSPEPSLKDTTDSSTYNDITQCKDSSRHVYSVTEIIPENAVGVDNRSVVDNHPTNKQLVNNRVKFTESKQAIVVKKTSETLTQTVSNVSKCITKVNEESLANRCMKKFKSSIPRLKKLPQKFPCRNTIDRLTGYSEVRPSSKIGKLVPQSAKVNKRVDMKFNSPFPEHASYKNQQGNRQMTYVYQVYNAGSNKTESLNGLSNESSTENKLLSSTSTKSTVSNHKIRTKNNNQTQKRSEIPKLVTIVPDRVVTDRNRSEVDTRNENKSAGDSNELAEVKNEVSAIIDDFDSLLNETIEDMTKNGRESSHHTFRIKSDISFTYKDNVINEVVVNKSITMQAKPNILENIKQNCSDLFAGKADVDIDETRPDAPEDVIAELNVCEVRKKPLFNIDDKPVILQHPTKATGASSRTGGSSGSTDSKQQESNRNDFLCCCPALFKKKGVKKMDKKSEKQTTVPSDTKDTIKGNSLTDNSIDQCFALWEDIYKNVTTQKKQGGPSTLNLNRKLLKYRFHDNSGMHEINITLDDLKKILRARAAVINDTNDTDDESSSGY